MFGLDYVQVCKERQFCNVDIVQKGSNSTAENFSLWQCGMPFDLIRFDFGGLLGLYVDLYVSQIRA